MNALLIIISGFLLGAGNSIGDVIRDCSLTCNVGYRFVPLPMMTIAFLTVPVASAQVRFQARGSATRWQIGSTLGAALFFIAFRYATYRILEAEELSRGDAARHAFWLETIRSTYIVYFVALELVFVMLWANLFVRVGRLYPGHGASQGMRLAAGAVMAGGLFGSVFAGEAAPALAQWLGARFETIRDHFMLVIAALILLDMPCVIATMRRGRGNRAAKHEAEKARFTIRGALAEIRSNRRVGLLAALFFSAGASLVIVDYLFYWIVREQAEAAPTGFVEFFSEFYVYLYAFSLIVLSFGAERVIKTLGLIVSVLLLPVTVFLGAAVFLLYKLLAVIYIVQIAKEGLSDSLYEDAAEHLIARVEPGRLEELRSMLEGFATRAGVAAAAAVLFTATFLLKLPEIWMAGMLLAVVAAWIGAAFSIRQKTL